MSLILIVYVTNNKYMRIYNLSRCMGNGGCWPMIRPIISWDNGKQSIMSARPSWTKTLSEMWYITYFTIYHTNNHFNVILRYIDFIDTNVPLNCYYFLYIYRICNIVRSVTFALRDTDIFNVAAGSHQPSKSNLPRVLSYTKQSHMSITNITRN